MLDENNSFSFLKPVYWSPKGCEETMNRLHQFLDLRYENDIDLHIKIVEKRGTRIDIQNSGYN